jgi:hypothetical protein
MGRLPMRARPTFADTPGVFALLKMRFFLNLTVLILFDMKRPAFQHRLTWALIIAGLLLAGLPLRAQSGTPAQSAAIDLDCQGCQPARESVRLLPGRKLALHGPPGTAPVKGDLVQGGDTITLRTGGLIRQVPTQDVTMVSITRPYLWLKLLVLHVLYLPYLLVAGIILGLSGAALTTVIVVLALPYLVVLIPLLATMYKDFKIGPWRIRRPLP